MPETNPVPSSKVLKTRGGFTVGPYLIQAPPKCNPYPPVYGYMYTSGPKSVGNTERQRKDRPLRKSDRALMAGEYFNTMFDPRVYRGSTYQDFKETERERCIKAQKQLERRDIIKKRKSVRASQYKLGGIIRPKTPPPKNRNLEQIATELFLIESLAEVEQKIGQTQTEVEQAPIPIPAYLKIKTGINMSTQIGDWELFDFEKEICVIAPVLTEKIIEQALTEAMEDEEQWFVRGVWATAHQKLHMAQSHMEVLRNQEKEYAAKVEARRLELFQEEIDNKRLQEDVECVVFALSFVSHMNRNVVDSLHKDGILYDMSYEAIKEEFKPWLNKQVRKEVNILNIAHAILDDIIITDVKLRAAAVLGDLGLEIVFGGTRENSVTHLCPTREMLISASNVSTDYEHEV